MKNIKSPISKEVVFENKLLKLFEVEKVEGAFIFYIPKKGDVHQFDIGLCPHQLLTLSKTIKDEAEKRLENNEDEH